MALCLSGAVLAEGFAVLARALPEGSAVWDTLRFGVRINLRLSQTVPHRIFTLADPPRLVMDFREVDWSALDKGEFAQSDQVPAIEYGVYVPGWSRMVLELGEPMGVRYADMRGERDGTARLDVLLERQDADEFAAAAGSPAGSLWELPEPANVASAVPRDPDAPLRVMLDPGHGGLDPGAQADGMDEKAVTLVFARELREELLRAGGFRVDMTRNEDRFVSLDRRVALAHKVGANVFISIHADALEEGVVHGASVHLLADEASDTASARLAARHDRGDILAGVDLSRTDDEVTGILLDIARQETRPRAESLGKALVAAMEEADRELIPQPLRHADYSVLKAADIPSVLVELGFMSSPRDLERLADPDWRRGMARAIRVALENWIHSDTARRPLVRH